VSRPSWPRALVGVMAWGAQRLFDAERAVVHAAQEAFVFRDAPLLAPGGDGRAGLTGPDLSWEDVSSRSVLPLAA
jgi:hypothetical protein